MRIRFLGSTALACEGSAQSACQAGRQAAANGNRRPIDWRHRSLFSGCPATAAAAVAAAAAGIYIARAPLMKRQPRKDRSRFVPNRTNTCCCCCCCCRRFRYCSRCCYSKGTLHGSTDTQTCAFSQATCSPQPPLAVVCV